MYEFCIGVMSTDTFNLHQRISWNLRTKRIDWRQTNLRRMFHHTYFGRLVHHLVRSFKLACDLSLVDVNKEFSNVHFTKLICTNILLWYQDYSNITNERLSRSEAVKITWSKCSFLRMNKRFCVLRSVIGSQKWFCLLLWSDTQHDYYHVEKKNTFNFCCFALKKHVNHARGIQQHWQLELSASNKSHAQT